MKTTLTSLIFLTAFSISTFAQDFSYTTIEPFERHWDLTAVALNQDASILAAANPIGDIQLWDVATRQLIKEIDWNRQGYRPDYISMAFSPDGRTIACGTEDSTIDLWSAVTSTYLKSLDGDASGQREPGRSLPNVTSVAFSPDGRTLASGIGDTIHLWNVDSEVPVGILEGHEAAITSVAFSPDGQTLASGSRDGTTRLWDPNLGRGQVLWDLSTGQQVDNTGQQDNNIEPLLKIFEGSGKVAFSPDGQTLASGRNLWDIATGLPKKTPWKTYMGTDTAFSPDGQILATAGEDTIDLWDVATDAHMKTLQIQRRGYSKIIRPILFSLDGHTLIAKNGSLIYLWQLPSTYMSVTPATIEPPIIGEQFTININIVAGENVGGYQFTLGFDPTALRYVESAYGDYLPPGSFVVPPVVVEDLQRETSNSEFIDHHGIMLGASSLAGAGNGDGSLATLTFEVIEVKKSFLSLSNVILTDSTGEQMPNLCFGGVVDDRQMQIGPEDVNGDGVINILDLVKVAARFGQVSEGEAEDVNGDGVVNIVDLVKVAAAIGEGAAAPSLHPQALAMFTAAEVQQWLSQTQQLNLTDATSQRGILFLEHLLAALTPKKTALLANYPNPFNPETWIPYQLAEPADVTLRIYAVDGAVVRTLVLGHQPVGIYQDKSHAAYWDGNNEVGEPVASGVYFYTLTAGNFTATRKMLIRK